MAISQAGTAPHLGPARGGEQSGSGKYLEGSLPQTLYVESSTLRARHTPIARNASGFPYSGLQVETYLGGASTAALTNTLQVTTAEGAGTVYV